MWTVLGRKYGYFLKASKSYFGIKEYELGEASNVFNNSNMNKNIDVKIHLSRFIGSYEYREEYVKYLGNKWNDQLVLLPSVAERET